MNDLELLRRYGRHDDQDAFATLVARHLNLVYSAARRQVRSPELAQEVTQAVFVELSQQALRLPENVHLTAWLYVAARRRAIDAIRRESARTAREQSAIALTPMNDTPSEWPEVERWVDQALHSLRTRDRQAVLLRFFENRSLREIGQALGTTDDGAQKRLSRALERLRAALVRRGVTTSAGALAAALTSHAVETAPAGLQGLITAAVTKAGGPIAGGALAGAGTAVASWVGRDLGLIAGAAIGAFALVVGAHLLRAQRAELQLLESRRAAIAQLEAERDRARADNAARQTHSPADAGTPSAVELRLRQLYARVAVLREALDRVPGARTPETALLEEKDWITAAQQAWDASSDAGVHHGLAFLQVYGKYRFAPLLSEALRRYLDATGGTPPLSAGQLAQYFSRPIDVATLDRFTVTFVSSKNGAPSAQLQEAMPNFDAEGDRILQVTANGWSVRPVGSLPADLRRNVPQALQQATYEAAMAYGRAHDGAAPATLQDLMPYFADAAVAKRALANPSQPDVTRDGLTPADIAAFRSAERAANAYKAAHDGSEPPSFAALLPYFQTPEDAANFQQAAQRHGRVLP